MELDRCPKCGSENLYSTFIEKGIERLKNEIRDEEESLNEFDGWRFGHQVFKSKINYILYICRDCHYVFTKEVEL